MRMGKWGFCVLGGVAVLAGLGVAEGQISNPGPQGPIIQDRMIFYEAALMQLDGRTQALESALKTKDAQLAKLEKELKEAKDKSAALEKRLAALENTLKKVAVGIERGPRAAARRLRRMPQVVAKAEDFVKVIGA